MDQVSRVGGAGRIGAPRVRAGQGGFKVPEGAPAPTAAVVVVELPGMLALQEAEGDWHRDRPARRHAQSMLDELAALQRALLAGEVDADRMERLASLARAMPHAVDPCLASLLRATAVRAAVELARRPD